MRAAAAARAAPAAVRPARPALPEGRLGAALLRAKTTLRGARARLGRGLFPRVSILRDRCAARCFSAALRAPSCGYDALERVRAPSRRRPAPTTRWRSAQYLDLKTYLVGDIMTKVDRASMAHSLEVREPLMDHRWSNGRPACRQRSSCARRGQVPAKKALEPPVPHEVLYRPKMGFAVPLARWFRGPLRERAEAALAGRSSRIPAVRPGLPRAAARPAPERPL